MGLCSKTSKQLYCEWVFSPYTFVANKPAVQARLFNATTRLYLARFVFKGKTLGRNILRKGYVAKTYIQNLVKHRWSWKNAEEARRKRQQTSMFRDFSSFTMPSMGTACQLLEDHSMALVNSQKTIEVSENSLCFIKIEVQSVRLPPTCTKSLNVLHQLTLSTAMTNGSKIYFVVCNPAPKKVVKLWHKPPGSFRLRT